MSKNQLNDSVFEGQTRAHCRIDLEHLFKRQGRIQKER